MRRSHAANQQGYILPVLLFTVIFIVTLIALVGSLSLTTYNLATRETYRVNAQLAADAGLDAGLTELNIDPDWTGTGGEIELMNASNIKTTYETEVLSGNSDDHKILAVTARTYSPVDAPTPKLTRKYEVDIQAVTSGTGASSVVTGVGGLILSNNAKISGGDVVVNGKITMGNNSQIGLTTNPVNVRVAHQSCPQPPDASYPQACGPGNGQPISMGNNAKIYADVRATNQTNGTRMYNPGLVAGETVAPITLPAYDRTAHKNAVATTVASNHSSVSCGNNGNKTWPANVKIVGNVNMGNNCRITITGDVWITGNVNMGNNSRFIVSNTLGTTRPTIMVDGGNTSGTGGFRFGNNAQIVPNSSNTGVQVVTFWSAAACSPECTTVTGPDLANSQNVLTISLDNNGSASHTILWSHWSRVRVANNGAIGAVTGQTIDLGNNAVINFTASVPGSDNLVTTWVKRGYMRVFD